jgi:hypothetical protein
MHLFFCRKQFGIRLIEKEEKKIVGQISTEHIITCSSTGTGPTKTESREAFYRMNSDRRKQGCDGVLPILNLTVPRRKLGSSAVFSFPSASFIYLISI